MIGSSKARSQAHERLRSVIQALPEGVVIVDRNGRVETVNRRAEELTGRTMEELADFVDDPPWRLFRSDGAELERHERPVVRALETHQPSQYERLRVVRHDGREFLFEYSATPILGDDGLDAVVLTFQDVTQQAARERAQRDFITNAAHELQTPLAAITSAIEVLQTGAKDRMEDRDRFLAHIESACARLDRLTRALLVLARAQALAESPRREVVAVCPLLDSVAESLPRDPGVDLRVDCPPDLAVVANRALLEQAIANLVHNAVKYTRGAVFLGAMRDDGRVRIVVRDSGVGIAPGDQDRIFERFYRSDHERLPGFGLGLAIVSDAIDAIDGEIGFETSPVGTTFAITLPAVRIIEP